MPSQRPSRTLRSDVERNRRVLLNAAIDALADNPGASMAEVAREANLNRATLYRHFGDRDHLLEAIRAEALLRAAEAGCHDPWLVGLRLRPLRRAVTVTPGTDARAWQ